jgi:hypothetical protein
LGIVFEDLSKTVTKTDGDVLLIVLGPEGEARDIEDGMNHLVHKGTHCLSRRIISGTYLKAVGLSCVEPNVGFLAFVGHLFDGVVSVADPNARR